MGKVFVAKIEVEYEVDENNYLHWEDEYEIEDKDKDEDFEPRSKEELIKFIAYELADIIYDASKRDGDLLKMISIEENGEN
jgi:hypothetical protein